MQQPTERELYVLKQGLPVYDGCSFEPQQPFKPIIRAPPAAAMSPSPAPAVLAGLLATSNSRLRKLLPKSRRHPLCALLRVLPMATRTGLGFLIAACGLLWLVWGLATPRCNGLGAINGWLLVYSPSP